MIPQLDAIDRGIVRGGRLGSAAARLAVLLVSGVLAVVVLLHLGLIGAGQWGGDEYFHFATLRRSGWHYLWPRLLHWSARPFSEALLYGYYWLVTLTRRPLIAPALAFLWAMLVGATLAHLFRAGRSAIAPRLLLGLAVFAAFLLGHPLAEMFYWPMSAAAYLPSLAGLSYAAFALLDGRLGPGPRGTVAAMLTLAAGSSEVGALFVALFIPLLLLPDRLRHGAAGMPILWALVPFGLTLGVLGLSMFGRVRSPLLPMVTTPTLGHFWLSFTTALAQCGREFLGLDAGASVWRALLFALPARVLLLLGFRWCLQEGRFAPVPAAHSLALALALFGASVVALTASYDLFGTGCCERHDTFRQCSYMLVLLALADIGRRDGPARIGAALAFGPVALFTGLLILFGGRGEQLLGSYRMYSSTVQARVHTWQSAAAPGPVLDFRDRPGPLTKHVIWPTGTFPARPSTPWHVLAIAQFFGKSEVRIAR